MTESSKNLINRKEALKRTAIMLGGVVSAPTMLGFLNGCTANPGPMKNFSVGQAEFIALASDVIIPETDTPGAKEVGVANYFEDMIFNIWEEEDRKAFLVNLEAFQAKAEKEIGKPFIEASEQERQDFIYKEHDAVFGGNVDWDAPRPFIWTMKEMTITGYFSTEVGMTQVQQWMMVPGYYNGCMPFEEAGGKVWAK